MKQALTSLFIFTNLRMTFFVHASKNNGSFSV